MKDDVPLRNISLSSSFGRAVTRVNSEQATEFQKGVFDRVRGGVRKRHIIPLIRQFGLKILKRGHKCVHDIVFTGMEIEVFREPLKPMKKTKGRPAVKHQILQKIQFKKRTFF